MGGRIEASLLSKGSTNLKAVVSMQAGDVRRRVGGGERWGRVETLMSIPVHVAAKVPARIVEQRAV